MDLPGAAFADGEVAIGSSSSTNVCLLCTEGRAASREDTRVQAPPPEGFCVWARTPTRKPDNRFSSVSSIKEFPDRGNRPFDLRVTKRQAARHVEALSCDARGDRMLLALEQSHAPQHRLLVHRPKEWPRAY